jgi:hypothetical protein
VEEATGYDDWMQDLPVDGNVSPRVVDLEPPAPEEFKKEIRQTAVADNHRIVTALSGMFARQPVEPCPGPSGFRAPGLLLKWGTPDKPERWVTEAIGEAEFRWFAVWLSPAEAADKLTALKEKLDGLHKGIDAGKPPWPSHDILDFACAALSWNGDKRTGFDAALGERFLPAVLIHIRVVFHPSYIPGVEEGANWAKVIVSVSKSAEWKSLLADGDRRILASILDRPTVREYLRESAPDVLNEALKMLR